MVLFRMQEDNNPMHARFRRIKLRRKRRDVTPLRIKQPHIDKRPPEEIFLLIKRIMVRVQPAHFGDEAADMRADMRRIKARIKQMRSINDRPGVPCKGNQLKPSALSPIVMPEQFGFT